MIHRHHIVPKHAGGTEDEDNIVLLTIEEHADAHNLLYCIYKRWQDKAAEYLLLNWNEDAQQLARKAGGRAAVESGQLAEARKNCNYSEMGRLGGKAKTVQPASYKAAGRASCLKRNKQVLTCPKCGHTGKSVGSMKRWHFDRCRAQ